MVSRSRNPNKKTNIPLVIQPDLRKKIKQDNAVWRNFSNIVNILAIYSH